jgi:hypothetical protein
VQRIERDDGTGGDAEFGQQRLCRRDLVGFLGDIDMGEHEGGVGGEGAEQLGGGPITEAVEAAAQRLAIKCDAALASAMLPWPGMARGACSRAAWRRKTASTAAGSSPWRM